MIIQELEKITNAGTITLAANSVGVYGDNAKIDFPVTINGTSGTGIYAESGSVVSGTINAGNSKDTVAVYLADNTASINGAVITAGGVTSTSSIGLYLGGTALTHTVGNSTINAPTSGTIGILTEKWKYNKLFCNYKCRKWRNRSLFKRSRNYT